MIRKILQGILTISLVIVLISELKAYHYEYVPAIRVAHEDKQYIAYYIVDDKEYHQEISYLTNLHLFGDKVYLHVNPDNPLEVKNHDLESILAAVSGCIELYLIFTMKPLKEEGEDH